MKNQINKDFLHNLQKKYNYKIFLNIIKYVFLYFKKE